MAPDVRAGSVGPPISRSPDAERAPKLQAQRLPGSSQLQSSSAVGPPRSTQCAVRSFKPLPARCVLKLFGSRFESHRLNRAEGFASALCLKMQYEKRTLRVSQAARMIRSNIIPTDAQSPPTFAFLHKTYLHLAGVCWFQLATMAFFSVGPWVTE